MGNPYTTRWDKLNVASGAFEATVEASLSYYAQQAASERTNERASREGGETLLTTRAQSAATRMLLLLRPANESRASRAPPPSLPARR